MLWKIREERNIFFPLILESANFNVSKFANIYVFNIVDYWEKSCNIDQSNVLRVPLWIGHSNICMEVYLKSHLKSLLMYCMIYNKSLPYQLPYIVQYTLYIFENQKDKFNQFKCPKTNCFPLDQSINQLIEEWSRLNII